METELALIPMFETYRVLILYVELLPEGLFTTSAVLGAADSMVADVNPVSVLELIMLILPI